MIDDLGGTDHVGELSDAQHERVVDECYQCKLCYVVCPYTPDQEQEWKIDFPRPDAAVARRATHDAGQSRAVARLLARTDLQGAVATARRADRNRPRAVEAGARRSWRRSPGSRASGCLPSYAT